jgi:uridine phosphorylase
MSDYICPPDFIHNNGPLFVGFNPKDVGRYVIFTVRDPLHDFSKDAAEEIADYLDQPKKIADTRMFTTYNGYYKGVLITICSTGSGAPELELAMMDFIKWSKADTFLRIGTSGALQKSIELGEIIITTGAVRDEGVSEEYVKLAYPAVASYDLVLALITSAENLKIKYHAGITRSNDAIYVGEGRPAANYIQEEHKLIPSYWERTNTLNVEREASLLLTLANIFGKRGSAVCTIVDNELTGELGVGAGKEESIKVSLEGIRNLAAWDQLREKKEKSLIDAEIIKDFGNMKEIERR